MSKINTNNKYQKRNYNNIFTTIMIIIITVMGTTIISKYNIDFSFLNPTTNKKSAAEQIQLNYAETNNKTTEGIYITDVSEVVENVMPSIVAITSKTLISSGQFGPNYYSQNKYSEGAGSGIIISKSDSELMILTNNHVIENATELSVQFINKKSFDAKIKGTSESNDIAIISIPINSLDLDTLEVIKIATLGDSDKLKVGNGIIAIGNALGYGQSVTTGVISALDRKVSIDNYSYKMIQIDAAINGGNSGGALLNSKGETIGINSAKYSANGSNSEASIEGMGFAIPISDVKDLITNLINGKDNSNNNNDNDKTTLGMEGYMVIPENNSNTPTGFYISKIIDGSDAYNANLQIGNIITKINGNNITAISDIQDIISNKKTGDIITLTISYNSGYAYKEKEISITLSA